MRFREFVTSLLLAPAIGMPPTADSASPAITPEESSPSSGKPASAANRRLTIIESGLPASSAGMPGGAPNPGTRSIVFARSARQRVQPSRSTILLPHAAGQQRFSTQGVRSSLSRNVRVRPKAMVDRLADSSFHVRNARAMRGVRIFSGNLNIAIFHQVTRAQRKPIKASG